MKSKEFWGLMVNPFTRIAGWQAFGLGMVFIVAMGIIGAYGNVMFDGVLDMHLSKDVSVLNSFSMLGIDLGSIVVVMWLTGLFFSKQFRFVDILGTMTLAKAPFLILAIAGFFAKAPEISQIVKNPYAIFSSVSFLVLIILSLPVMIWSVTLMYNALKVSCDIKGSKLTISFIAAILIAEIISKTTIYLLLQK